MSLSAKIAIQRPKDYEFLEDVVHAGLVNEETLLERWAIVPRVDDPEKMRVVEQQIREAFQDKRDQQM